MSAGLHADRAIKPFFPVTLLSSTIPLKNLEAVLFASGSPVTPYRMYSATTTREDQRPLLSSSRLTQGLAVAPKRGKRQPAVIPCLSCRSIKTCSNFAAFCASVKLCCSSHVIPFEWYKHQQRQYHQYLFGARYVIPCATLMTSYCTILHHYCTYCTILHHTLFTPPQQKEKKKKVQRASRMALRVHVHARAHA